MAKRSSVSAVTGSAPLSEARKRFQVQPRDLGVGYLAHSKFVGKVWSGGNGAAVFVHGLQPAGRAREKRKRGEHHDGQAKIKRHQPSANQSHIVIERQPAYAHVIGPDVEGLADGAHVRKQIGVSEHYAFGIACGSGSVLEERQIAWQIVGQII